jgi:hypothetical protein
VKVLFKNLAIFLSISQQGGSVLPTANIILNSAVVNYSLPATPQKKEHKEQRQKQLG